MSNYKRMTEDIALKTGISKEDQNRLVELFKKFKFEDQLSIEDRARFEELIPGCRRLIYNYLKEETTGRDWNTTLLYRDLSYILFREFCLCI